MKVKGEAEPEDLIHSGSTVDSKPWYIVNYNLKDALVALQFCQVVKTTKWLDTDELTISAWLWSKGLKELRTWQVHAADLSEVTGQDYFPRKFFKYKKHAEAYLSYARLKGFAIQVDLPEKPKKKLRVIKLKN